MARQLDKEKLTRESCFLQKKQREEFVEKNDTDSDGELSEEEFNKVKNSLWKKALELFDVDKNGKMEGTEEIKRLAWLREKHPGFLPHVYIRNKKAK